MQTIEYKGRSYPIRVLVMKNSNIEEGTPDEYIIASDSLSKAISPSGYFDNDMDDEGEGVDNQIYFYIGDNDIDKPAKEIAEKLLDEPFVLVNEEE